MSDSITIRPIEPGDKSAWRALWTAYLTFYESSVSDAVYDATFDRLCADNQQNQKGFLALQDGVPVGLVHYIYHAHNWRLEDVCYLQDLYADPSVRGTGVGRKLIEGGLCRRRHRWLPLGLLADAGFQHASAQAL